MSLARLPWRHLTVALISAVAAACASAPPPQTSPGGLGPGGLGPGAPPPISTPSGPPPAGTISPAVLPGWNEEDHLAGFEAYVAGCGVAREAAARRVCASGRDLARGRVSQSDARAFFEANFSAVPARTADGRPGLLTSYFAPEYLARRRADREFDTPVLARPDGWRRGQVLATRAEIEAGPPPTPVLGWMKAEDLFFLQIQGSGYLTFEDGGRARAAYAADNGRTFVGIARPMAERGLLPQNGTSGDAIRAWLAAHRGPEARAITGLNPRYIYFDLQPDDGGHPAGAAAVPLPPRRSIAVDPAHWTYGDLVWIDADGGNLAGARASYRGLVSALDTGSAIRGPVRADLYMGRGEAAGSEAGAVRHPLRMWRLAPR